ncbi:hypothetical protein S7335_2379 [Synechococcus sp. PCC 7335]|uniref:hypothetical protein n=1 Tax=Synechococcus sp. (strain ATCC 29403 / PCC 7335) TaxID=91464 RepID=UPI00017EE009|nr:hypothetical protein [Synechococcus sp. PCC 7335]EDX84682.1 hypothetical protein S7335_2379 [Synechococcus sp. PCC 7335]
MSNPLTETLEQARQGSVAAIIQVFNERLADSGIRIRAVIDSGILQLLCEAASPDQLEKKAVVEKVRRVLETIRPRHIKKVKINSRIVKEEQLLWLDEISKDPENTLLWSEVVTLQHPFAMQRWIRDRHLMPKALFLGRTTHAKMPDSLPSKLLGIGSVGIAALALVTGWTFREDILQLQQGNPDLVVTKTEVTSSKSASPAQTAATTGSIPAPDAADRTPDTPSPAASPTVEILTAPAEKASQTGDSADSTDAFTAAVRIAQKASIDGQTAATAAEWLDLAARWQRAADLMAQIPPDLKQYAIAQDRVSVYSANSKTALERAAAL